MGFLPKLAFSYTKTPPLAELRAAIREKGPASAARLAGEWKEGQGGPTSLFLVLENPRRDADIAVDLFEVSLDEEVHLLGGGAKEANIVAEENVGAKNAAIKKSPLAGTTEHEQFSPAFHTAAPHEHLSDLCDTQQLSRSINRCIIHSYQKHFLDHKQLVQTDRSPVASTATAAQDINAGRDDNANLNASRLFSTFQQEILPPPTLEVVLGTQTAGAGGATILKDISVPAGIGGVAPPAPTENQSDGAFVVHRKGGKLLLEIPVRMRDPPSSEPGSPATNDPDMVLYLKLRCRYEDGSNLKHAAMSFVRLTI